MNKYFSSNYSIPYVSWVFQLEEPKYDIYLQLEELFEESGKIDSIMYGLMYDGYAYSYIGVINLVYPTMIGKLKTLFVNIANMVVHPLSKIDMDDLIVSYYRNVSHRIGWINHKNLKLENSFILEGPFFIGYTKDRIDSLKSKGITFATEDYEEWKKRVKEIFDNPDDLFSSYKEGIRMEERVHAYERYYGLTKTIFDCPAKVLAFKESKEFKEYIDGFICYNI